MSRLINPYRFGGRPNYRYYRFTFYGTMGDVVCPARIQMASTPGGADFTGSKTYSGSGSQIASYAFDSNLGVIWYDGWTVTDPYLQIDCGSPTRLAEFIVTARNDAWYYQAPTNIGLAGSNDGTNWTGLQFYSNISWASAGQTQTFTVPIASLVDLRASAFLWRVRVTATVSGAGPSFAELIFANSNGGATICTGGSPLHQAVFAGPATTYGPTKAFDGNNGTFSIAKNDGCVGGLGYIFASSVAPVQMRMRARNDGYHNEAPKNGSIQWSSNGFHWTDTDTFTNLTWSSGEEKSISIS